MCNLFAFAFDVRVAFSVFVFLFISNFSIFISLAKSFFWCKSRARVGERGYVQATFLTGFDGTKAIFDSYRRAWREAGRGDTVPQDRLAYAALVYTGETEAEAHAGAEKLLWYITSNKVPPHFASPPGYVPIEAGVKMLRGAEHPLSAFAKAASVEAAIKAGIMMAGTPDQVVKQIRAVYRPCRRVRAFAQHGSGGIPGA